MTKDMLISRLQKYFDEEFGETISQWAVIRNILAHEYLNIRWNSIERLIHSTEPI